MGNCMDTCLPRQQASQEDLHGEIEAITTCKQNQKTDTDEEDEVQDGAFRKGDGKEVGEIAKADGGGSVRVKIVLTKEELQWLLMQLKSDGEKNLKNMLEEVERGRRKVVCDGVGKNSIGSWKPSLESIMETPELIEMNRSIRL